MEHIFGFKELFFNYFFNVVDKYTRTPITIFQTTIDLFDLLDFMRGFKLKAYFRLNKTNIDFTSYVNLCNLCFFFERMIEVNFLLMLLISHFLFFYNFKQTGKYYLI